MQGRIRVCVCVCAWIPGVCAGGGGHMGRGDDGGMLWAAVGLLECCSFDTGAESRSHVCTCMHVCVWEGGAALPSHLRQGLQEQHWGVLGCLGAAFVECHRQDALQHSIHCACIRHAATWLRATAASKGRAAGTPSSSGSGRQDAV